MKPLVVFVVVASVLSLASFAFLERLTSGYVGTCNPGDTRCAGIAVQECINGRWFFKKFCQFGTVCDPETKACRSKKEKTELPKPTFPALKNLGACMEGKAYCEAAHILMYCRNKTWQREVCKTGFRCDSRRLGCKPTKPVVGLKSR